MKILIAEDNAFSRTLLKKTLSKAGYEVEAAENGNAAWEILQSDDPPRLALLDWMMPGLSGIELCRKIREIDLPVPIYMILLTAKSDKEDVLAGFAAGADDFIKKPFDSGELLARIQVGRRLIEQQALLYCLIDSIPDPIYMKDSRGLYLGCNKAYADFVNADAEKISGRTASDILPGNEGRASHMEDLRVLASGEMVESEGWTTAADGRPVYHETIKIPYLESAVGSTGMIGMSRDLTRRIEMEQEMHRLAVAVEQSTESIMITDTDGVILYVNAAFESVYGYTVQEAIGRNAGFRQSGKQGRPFFEDLWKTISSGETWSGEFINKKKDGSIMIEESVIYPIRGKDGQLINYVSIGRDITQDRELEKYMRQQQKMNAIGVLAGGVSHDFNNILTAILGYVALCMNSVEEDSKVFGYLREIVKAGDRATKLVRQILTFSRQEEQEFQALQLQGIVEDSLSMCQTTMKKTISVEQEIDPACGPVLGDPTQLQQVMVNLCTNAAHALADMRSGTLCVKLKQVEIGAEAGEERVVDLDPGEYALIMVEDNGCGMPPEVAERIFEPYFTTKKKGEGTGFGLSIVHGIVIKHRGLIQVKSEEGVGTVFSVYFPILKDEVSASEAVLQQGVTAGEGRILFVDDDEAILSMGREMLESFGYSVATAANGQDALAAFKENPDSFDVLVTDYSMPKTNGHELIKQALQIRADIPAILCSGYMERVEGEDLRKLGHAAYMAKPINWQELSRTIRDSLVSPG